MSTRAPLPRWAAWAIGAGLVAAAWGVALVTPGDDQVQSPFPVTVAVGEEGVGRNISATVTDIRRVGELTAENWSVEGNWLVVDLDVASVVSEFGVLMTFAEISMDGVRYSASERPDSLRQQGLAAGIPRSGSLAFELPADLQTGQAILELAVDGDTRLDSVIVVPFDLGDVTYSAEGELRETGWTNP
jgi:hypothetical protein